MTGYRDFTDFLASILWIYSTNKDEARQRLDQIKQGDTSDNWLGYRFYGLPADEREYWRQVAELEIAAVEAGGSITIRMIAEDLFGDDEMEA